MACKKIKHFIIYFYHKTLFGPSPNLAEILYENEKHIELSIALRIQVGFVWPTAFLNKRTLPELICDAAIRLGARLRIPKNQ